MRRPPADLLVAAGAFLAAAACLFWHASVQSVQPGFDEAWYLETAYRFYHALTLEGPLALARAWTEAFRFKAPFASAAPLPFFAVFGLSYRTAVVSNAAALAVLALSVRGLGASLFSPAAGGLAAAFAMLMPLTAALSRTFFVETWQAAWTAAFLWRLAASDQLRVPRSAVELGVLFAAGLLTKVTFPGIVAGPVALALWARLRDPRGPDAPGLKRFVRAFALSAGVPAATWYAPNLVTVAAFTLAGYRGPLAAAYGSTNAWNPDLVATYFLAIGRDVLSAPFVALVSALLVAERRRLAAPGFRFIAVWVVPYLLLTTSGYAKDQRYVAPVVPAFALLAGALVDSWTSRRPYRAALMALALMPSAYVFALQTFGPWTVPPPPPALYTLAPVRTNYGGPPARHPDWGQERLVEELAARLPPGAVVVFGIEHPRLNANILAMLAARDRRPLSFVHYGHMEGDPMRALVRMSEKDATHILFVEGVDRAEVPPMVPAVDERLRAAAAAGRIPFRSLGRIQGSAGIGYELFERTGPIRMVP